MNSTPAPASHRSETEHWSAKYLGRPWVSGAMGPDAFDCWGLLWAIYRERGIELHRYPGIDQCGEAQAAQYFTDEQQNPDWLRIDTPEEGCAVAIGFSTRFHHVGVYTEADGGLIVHTLRRRGVIAHSISAMRSIGLNKIEFYRHARARN